MHAGPPSRVWAHGIITLRGWWIPGDARGFRSREHRIHSSGDYRNPPPPGEHAALRDWNRARTKREPPLRPQERELVGRTILERFEREARTTLAIACAATHTHALFEAGDEDARRILGLCKQVASRRLHDRCGRVWAQGAGIDRIRSRAHQLAAFEYIARHADSGAWVWRFDQAPLRAQAGE